MLSDRRHWLQSRGLDQATTETVLAALSRPLPSQCPDPAAPPLNSELFIADWLAATATALRHGTLAALREQIVELHFPVSPGIKTSPSYHRACLDPATPADDLPTSAAEDGPVWQAPDGLSLFLHETGVGLLPVIEAAASDDFVTLVRAIGYRNEPVPIPASMGANFVNGYTNRRRFLAVRDAHRAGALHQYPPDPALWKDRLLLLSHGPYSSVPAHAFGLNPTDWLDQSRTLRLHHESCHYLVRRLFPRLTFGIQDELVADFAGLVAATGSFRAHSFLTFMGLEAFPHYRPGGRLENYHRNLADHPDAIHAVRHLLVDAAHALETFFAPWSADTLAHARLPILATLTFLPLELLASPQAAGALDDALAHLQSTPPAFTSIPSPRPRAAD